MLNQTLFQTLYTKVISGDHLNPDGTIKNLGSLIGLANPRKSTWYLLSNVVGLEPVEASILLSTEVRYGYKQILADRLYKNFRLVNYGTLKMGLDPILVDLVNDKTVQVTLDNFKELFSNAPD